MVISKQKKVDWEEIIFYDTSVWSWSKHKNFKTTLSYND